MAAPDEFIRRIQEKLQLLIRQSVTLRKENEKMRTELHEMRAAVRQKDELIQILELRIEVLKSAKGDMQVADKKMLEKKINQYIKEVDKCLALLND